MGGVDGGDCHSFPGMPTIAGVTEKKHFNLDDDSWQPGRGLKGVHSE
jgi:hypothetical protein